MLIQGVKHKHMKPNRQNSLNKTNLAFGVSFVYICFKLLRLRAT